MMAETTGVPVVRLAPGHQWDQHLLDLLFTNRLWQTGLEFERFDAYTKTPGIILIAPGRYWAGHEQEISGALARYDWVLAIRTSDEEDLFELAKVEHQNLRWWTQTPRVGRDYGTARFIPLGFPPHFDALGVEPPDKTIDVFMSAQNTHSRREQAFDALAGTTYLQRILATGGFTQGLQPAEYAQQMCQAKVAPAPSGAVSPDSFRLWEALQSHAIPIADAVSPVDGVTDYWRRLFGDPPFPVIENYGDLPGYIGDQLADYPRNANRIAAWWIAQKRAMALNLREDLRQLGAL